MIHVLGSILRAYASTHTHTCCMRKHAHTYVQHAQAHTGEWVGNSRHAGRHAMKEGQRWKQTGRHRPIR
eukprot:13283803-Alexandrium_andersonii.AAC.1